MSIPYYINYYKAILLTNFVYYSGVNKADYDELDKIDEVFCGKDRKVPIKVGSVKSNMGHCEASSALAALIKVRICYL